MGFKCFEYCICDFVQQLKLAPQIKCEIFFVTSLFILSLTGLIYLKIYLISLSLYKDISNTIDTHEFNELSYIEIFLENSELQFEQSFKDFSYLISQEFDIILNSDAKTFASGSTLNLKGYQPCSGNTNDEDKIKQAIDNMNHIFETIKLIKTFSNSKDSLLTSILIFQPNTFYYSYPDSYIGIINENTICENNSAEKSDEKFGNDILEEIKKQGKNIASFKKVFPRNMNDFKNVFLLPVFTEEYENFEYIYKEKKVEPKAYSFVVSGKMNTDTNKNKNIYVVVVGTTPSTTIIYDKIIGKTPGVKILKADYKFPYKLKNTNTCEEVRLLSIYDDEKDAKIQKYGSEVGSEKKEIFIDQCFDQERTIKKYQSNSKYKSLTTREEFQDNFKLFKRTEETNVENVKELISLMEESVLKNNETAFNQTINLIMSINDEDYKIKKIYSPFAVGYQLDYFYPFSTFSMHFLIKNQGFSRFISREVSNIMQLNIINGLIYCFFLMIVSAIGLNIILRIFLEQINKPVVKLNDTKFITGQSNQEDPKSSKNEEEKETNIDEFKELIQIINEMVKGDMDLKQVHNQKEEIKFKLDIENFNKEFDQVKIFNIMVKEEEIEQILEESNCTSEIVKRDINEIRKDKFVKKSTIFNSMIDESKKEIERTKGRQTSKKDTDGKRKSFLEVLMKTPEINKYTKAGRKEIFEKKIKKGKLFSSSSLQNKSNLLYHEFKRSFDAAKVSH